MFVRGLGLTEWRFGSTADICRAIGSTEWRSGSETDICRGDRFDRVEIWE